MNNLRYKGYTAKSILIPKMVALTAAETYKSLNKWIEDILRSHVKAA